MNLSELFKPVNIDKDLNIVNYSSDSWVNKIETYNRKFPDLDNKKIALIGIVSEEYPYEADKIRSSVYSLKKCEYASIIADLGNYEIPDNNLKQLEKLGYLLSELHNMNLLPVIIGSPQQISFSQFLAYEFLKQYVNFISFDSTIDFRIGDTDEITNMNFLYWILVRDPSYLFNLSHLGYQTYLTDSDNITTMDNQYFDLLRLGKIKENLQVTEPIIRSADILSFDLSSIKQGDSPGCNHPSPNGFTAGEACNICRYAGLSDNLNSVGFYEYNLNEDKNGQTSNLVAQMIWYFADGYLQRISEKVNDNPKNFTKYITSDETSKIQITFFKSIKTNRWWMEIPAIGSVKNYFSGQYIPCSYHDYTEATKGNIPERWLKAYKKLHN